MAKLTVTKLHCTRQQDVTGKDEPVLFLGGQERWNGKIDKGETLFPSVSEEFHNSIVVELKERNGSTDKKDKSLGKWTVYPTPSGSKPLTATSSGFDYTVTVDVS
jgi:hypothetical protein